MVAGRPYYQRFQADFIMGVRGYDLETVGAYSLIIDHLNDRDRPLPDDDRFMAGLLHCSARRWRKIRDQLIADGKLLLTPDGYLSNPRFEREREGRQQQRREAQRNGKLGGQISAAIRAGQAELDLDHKAPDPSRTHARARSEAAKTADESKKFGQNFRESSADQSPNRDNKSNEIKPPAQPPPQAPCARDSSESREETHPNRSSTDSPDAGGRLDDADLVELTQSVCEAAGYRPVSPAQIDRATALVEEWRKSGISFDEIVLPTIEAAMARSTEPTRTLGRFKAAVAHEVAKARARGKTGRAYRAPDKPLLSRPDEPDLFRNLRASVLERVGAETFATIFNSVRFEDARDPGDKRRPVRVHGPDHLIEAVVHGRYASVVRNAAQPLGFDQVWKGAERA